MTWIAKENRELSFVEKDLVRKYTAGNLNVIDVITLKKRMTATVQYAEGELKKTLPKKFRLRPRA